MSQFDANTGTEEELLTVEKKWSVAMVGYGEQLFTSDVIRKAIELLSRPVVRQTVNIKLPDHPFRLYSIPVEQVKEIVRIYELGQGKFSQEEIDKWEPFIEDMRMAMQELARVLAPTMQSVVEQMRAMGEQFGKYMCTYSDAENRNHKREHFTKIPPWDTHLNYVYIPDLKRKRVHIRNTC